MFSELTSIKHCYLSPHIELHNSQCRKLTSTKREHILFNKLSKLT